MILPRALLLTAATAVAFAEEASSLPKDSPFVPSAAAATVVTNPNEGWEFAAVQTVDKKTSVYIFDRAAKKGKWIGVGETADGVTVKSYDAPRDLVVVRVGGVDKTLALRKASATPKTAANVSAQPWAPPAGWNLPPPAPGPAVVVNSGSVTVPAANATPAVVGTPQPPATPGTVAHQEQEARMLVSDLLEIGIAQRKAYEEAQKKAAAEKAVPAVPAAPPPRYGLRPQP